MLTSPKLFLAATVAAIAMPVLASAAVMTFDNTVSVNENYSFSGVIQPDDTLQFRFTVLDDLLIDTFSVSATGNADEDDVAQIRFGLVEPVTGEFTVIQSIGSVSAGLGFIDGASFVTGSMFSVFFTDGINNDVGVTLSFGTEAIAPIPLPASGLLMVPFLLAGGIAGWRRRKSGVVPA